MELAAGITLWSPVTIIVCGVSFQTTFETLQQYPRSELSRLFSPPYPLLSAESGHHVFPPERCPHPDLFGYILDFLRTKVWHIPQDREIYAHVCKVAAALEIPSRPPPVVDVDFELPRFDHKVVTLPVPEANTSEDTNTAIMVSALGFKGYKLVSETMGDAPRTTNITLQRRTPICKGVELLARQSPLFQKVLQCA